MSRSLLFLAAALAVFITTGCGGSVDSPSPVDGTTDTGNTDETGVITSTLTVEMGDIGDNVAEVSVIEDGKADASPVWSGRLAKFEQIRIEVLPATYAITVRVDGYLPWDISVPVGDGGAEVPVPEEELEPEINPEVELACQQLDQQIGGDWEEVEHGWGDMTVVVETEHDTCAVTTYGEGAIGEGGTGIHGLSLPVYESDELGYYTIWLEESTLFAELRLTSSGTVYHGTYRR